MLTSYDVIIIFLIYGQFGAIPKLDSRRIVSKVYNFIKVTFYCKRELKNLTQL